MQNVFSTPEPTSLYVEIGSGTVQVRADDVTETMVSVDGRDADDVTVEQRGNQIVVIAPHRRGVLFGGSSSELSVHVTLPTHSELTTKLGSADLVATGRYGSTRIKSGSGDVRIEETGRDAVFETGSGDIHLDTAHSDLRIKTGSGDVEAGRLTKSAAIVTGSGDVTLANTADDTVVKSGSGDIRITEAQTDLSATTASGDVTVGTIYRGGLRASAVSGDVMIGVPAGIPVWTDISCVSGRVRSNLEGAGEPEEGQDFIEVRAKTVSGDIRLEQR